MSLFVGSITVRANLWPNLKSDAERSHGQGHPHSHSRFSVSCLSESLFPTILVAPAHLQAAQLVSLFLFYATCLARKCHSPNEVAGRSDFGGRPDQTGPPGVEQVGWGTRGSKSLYTCSLNLGERPSLAWARVGHFSRDFG